MFKIDTKTSFIIFRLSEEETAENMSGQLKSALAEKRKEEPGNAIIALPEKGAVSADFIQDLIKLQSEFQKENLSFVVAPVSIARQKEHPAWKGSNHTPTLKEAIDLIMMEILERELLGPDTDTD